MLESLWQLLWHFLPLPLIIFLGGIAVGVLGCSAIAAYLDRKPVIAQRIDIIPKLEDLFGSLELQSLITVSNGENSYNYRDLHTVQVELTNQSRQNFDEFEFGIALASDAAIVHMEVQSPDRHRVVKPITPFSFGQPRSQVDLSLQPFNREDSYTFRLLIIVPEGSSSLGTVTLSSPEAARFAELPTTQELLKKAAKAISLPLGPFKISFR
ncbi:hypothetical protein [Leptolyngbya sp. FACHB-711]|uniref:hypothetical protein n=1 Tax=unclassified Leptolyngbya TaxID=2650499 RepID=UPI001688D12D|nr:hypothetical protein [Leptolyngbya sp. FACHB-711]MBD1853994.1 hypothetical protein [Cyanobacteria bacterium FACHB-502]MBD2023081.1 hypothetical protein [Leptolyngbya sp. FACHB-711]